MFWKALFLRLFKELGLWGKEERQRKKHWIAEWPFTWWEMCHVFVTFWGAWWKSDLLYMSAILWEKGLTHSHTKTPFDAPGKQAFWKHCGKRRNCSSQAISPFPTVFSTCLDNFLLFSSNLKLSSANSFSLEESKICRLVKGWIFCILWLSRWFDKQLHLFPQHFQGCQKLSLACGWYILLQGYFGKFVLLHPKLVNLFRNRPWFLHMCITSLLKTLWKKEKLLILSNFFFSHSVFLPSWIIFCHFHQFQICSLQTLSVWKSLKQKCRNYCTYCLFETQSCVLWTPRTKAVQLFTRWQNFSQVKIENICRK